MRLDLGLQDPGAPSGLLEILLEACDGADRGGGIFAWATREGARLLFEAPTFQAFASASPFELVIGVDAITDVRALDAVRRAAARLDGFSARVLNNDLNSVLFHPKLSWFVSGDRLTLITGSGNLTRGGLRTNWEAFTRVVVEGEEAERIEAQLEAWLRNWEDSLLDPSDPRVLAQARRNSGRERDLKLDARPDRAPGGEGGDPAHHDEAVFVATIGRGERWTQANFPRRFYEGFFRARVGTKRHILFQPVASDGSLGELESRESVEVDSDNYRFELTAGRGLGYPDGRDLPIAVFVRSRDGVFRYMLLMPGDSSYAGVAMFLAGAWPGGRELPRVETTVAELRFDWPRSPLWRT
jgi:hypothetical protein